MIKYGQHMALTFVLLNHDIYPAFANSVDPDQLASSEANWSGSSLFDIQYVSLYQEWIKLFDWLTIRDGHGILIYSA